MKPAICLDPLFPELLLENKIHRIANPGFRCVEFWGWRDKNIPALLEACQRHQVEVVNFSGHRRFDPNFTRVREAVTKKEIGDLHMVRIASRDPSPPPVECIKSSGELSYDMTIHDFDMVRFLTGNEIREVHANGTALVDEKIGKIGEIDTAAINIIFENGVPGFIENSRQAAYGYDQRVEVLGSRGIADAANVQTNSVAISTAKDVKNDLRPSFYRAVHRIVH